MFRQPNSLIFRPFLETYYVPTSPGAWDTGSIGPPWNPTGICKGGKTHARRIRTRRPGTPGADAEPRGSRALSSLGVRRASEGRNAPPGGGARGPESGNERAEPGHGSRSKGYRRLSFDRRRPPTPHGDGPRGCPAAP